VIRRKTERQSRQLATLATIKTSQHSTWPQLHQKHVSMASTDISRVIHRPGASAVTYDLSTPNRVRITVSPGSQWSSGLHWHETHTEYLRVIRGRARVRLGDVTKIVSPLDGEVEVGRYVWHQWERADVGGGAKGMDEDDDEVDAGNGEVAEELVVEERTEPEDGEKAIFFWNLNGVILSAGSKRPGWRIPPRLWGLGLDIYVTLSLFVIFGQLDNVPVFLDVRWWLERIGIRLRPADGSLTAQAVGLADWAASHVVLGLAGWIGSALDVKAVRREFTPEIEYRSWVDGREDGKKAR
jgi:mannose-6-phosphate isomerase-like protein (cupin superfamily)